MSGFSDKMIVFEGEGIGRGDPALSSKMMHGFLKMLTKQTPKPKTLFFLGDSVKLLVKDSPVLEFLQLLKQDGVEVLVCRAAVEWYYLEDDLEIGKIISTGLWFKLLSELDVITL
ncbi:MAG: DsrE family protein [Desulfitobacteriaceae bacterium]